MNYHSVEKIGLLRSKPMSVLVLCRRYVVAQALLLLPRQDNLGDYTAIGHHQFLTNLVVIVVVRLEQQSAT